jgi:hypothetical protein
VTRPDPSFAIAVTQRSDSWMANVKSLLLIACLHVSAHTDRHVEKESLDDYIAKKREMFLVEVGFVFGLCVCVCVCQWVFMLVCAGGEKR